MFIIADGVGKKAISASILENKIELFQENQEIEVLR